MGAGAPGDLLATPSGWPGLGFPAAAGACAHLPWHQELRVGGFRTHEIRLVYSSRVTSHLVSRTTPPEVLEQTKLPEPGLRVWLGARDDLICI